MTLDEIAQKAAAEAWQAWCDDPTNDSDMEGIDRDEFTTVVVAASVLVANHRLLQFIRATTEPIVLAGMDDDALIRMADKFIERGAKGA